MAKGFDPGEILNLQRKMKDEMTKAQEKLKECVVEGVAGDGLVTAFVNGSSEVVGIKIDPDAVDTDDLSELEDLVMIAVNKGLEKATELHNEEMNRIGGGMGLGGLGNMFG
ncbi:MAG: YbaB/EbfC family nucleoid-associated protein [Planctomycetota bacterium]